MIRYISIDFWDTLFQSTSKDNSTRRDIRSGLFIDYCASLGVTVTPEQVDTAFHAAWDYFEHRWLNEHRTPDAVELVRFLTSHLDIRTELKNIDIIANAIAKVTSDIPPPLCEDSLKTILPALAQHYTLGIISDTSYAGGNVLRDVMRMNDIEKYFSRFAFSDEVGRSKPHPVMFETIIGDLSNAHELLHIGDLGKTDVAGAKAIGAYAIRYTRFTDEPHATIREDAVMQSWEELPGILERLTT